MRFRMITVAVIAVLAIAGGLYAVGPNHELQMLTVNGPVPATGTLPDVLPPVPRGPMQVNPAGEATSILQFDDGTCEANLGFGVTTLYYSAVVDFDVPTQCIQAGLEIVGITGRIDGANTTGVMFGQSLVYFQSGASPGVGRGVVPLIPPIATLSNWCSQGYQTMATRFISPGQAVIQGTGNFFAGLFNNGYMARDTGVSQGRMWLRTNTTGSTYSPAVLAGLGFPGNWFFRVTVEDQNCVPVELQSITIQ